MQPYEAKEKQTKKEKIKMEITYKDSADETAVFLKKKFVGTIKLTENGWCYFPKNQKTGGDSFVSLQLCKKSLEEE
jgi:hypothetical protein